MFVIQYLQMKKDSDFFSLPKSCKISYPDIGDAHDIAYIINNFRNLKNDLKYILKWKNISVIHP